MESTWSIINRLEYAIKYETIENVKEIIETYHLKNDILNFTYILHFAVENRCIDICEYLIEFGCDVNLPNTFLAYPIHIAACFNYLDICELLLQNGASINQINATGDTALHSAACWSYLPLCELLLKYGADPNIKNSMGKTFRDITKSEVIRSLGSGDKTKVCRRC